MTRSMMACFGRPQAASRKSLPDQSAPESVVVELFTSQGCAASPEADTLASCLGRGDFGLNVNVIVLEFHVDYWDYMGWKDQFGSSQWTVRQKAYVESLELDTMFTPQVVVQGRSHCLGTDRNALLASIQSALRFPTPSFQATFEKLSRDSLRVSVTGALGTKVDGKGANVMVAVYENGLVTDCPKGENKGRVLSNDFVVRRLEKLCTVRDVSARKMVTGNATFDLWSSFDSRKCGVVVFIQSTSHQMFGSLAFQLPENL